MAFNCEFNAPQFFDFNEIAEGPAQADVSMAEKYFAFDHENEHPVEMDPEAAANDDVFHPLPPKTEANPVEIPTSTLVQRMRMQETPNRRSLREAVAQTIENVVNSPKVELPSKRASPFRRSHLEGGRVEKNKNPTIDRWRKAVKALTPDLLRKARSLRQQQQVLKSQSTSTAEACSQRLASTTTSSTKAREKETLAFKKSALELKVNLDSYRPRVTQPLPFHFATDMRKHHQHRKEEEAGKAKPQPMKAASGQVDFSKMLRNYDESKHHEVVRTEMKPFNFASIPRRQRSRSADPVGGTDRLAKLDDKSRIIKAKPMPHFGVPVFLPNASKKSTLLQPFSFDTRDLMSLKRKQEHVLKVIEQEKLDREFKARPMPDLEKPIALPLKEVTLATETKPFRLEIEKRVEARVQKWQKDVDEEFKKQREAANFKANPAKVLDHEPFIPHKSDKPLLEVSNFELHSDKRAKEREVFEQKRKQHEAELEAMKRQLEDRRRLEEDEEVRRLRREAVHKAQPVKQFRPMIISQSDKPLTEPISPKFTQKRRPDSFQ